jgi:hypothetical protein
MKKYIVALVIVAILVGFIVSRKPFQKESLVGQQISREQLLGLPETWKSIGDTTVALKLEKTVDGTVKPQIVLINSSSKDALTPAKYTDRLVAGAKSAVPTLRIITDKRNAAENNYSALISGYYFNGKTKINLLQRIYIKGESVSTLTASYTGELEAEINRILDSIVQEKIGQ